MPVSDAFPYLSFDSIRYVYVSSAIDIDPRITSLESLRMFVIPPVNKVL